MAAEKRRVKEVVGVAVNASQLDEVVERLEMAGFDRAAISILGQEKGGSPALRASFEDVLKAEDDPKASRTAPVDRVSTKEGQAAAVGIPLQIGAFAGAAVAVASGGALAVAIAAMALGAAGGAGLGGILAYAIGKKYHKSVADQVGAGGLVVWAATPDKDSENRAIKVMKDLNLRDVHAHVIEITDPAPRVIQPDPLLERDHG